MTDFLSPSQREFLKHHRIDDEHLQPNPFRRTIKIYTQFDKDFAKEVLGIELNDTGYAIH